MEEQEIILKDSITVMLLPFSYEDEASFLLPESSIWERTHNFTVDKNYLYSHIQKFLTGNAVLPKDANIDAQDCVIYSLKDNIEQVAGDDKCILKVFGQTMRLMGKDDAIDSVGFKLLNVKKNMASPKLILHPYSSVGLLMLSFELVSNGAKQDDLMSLNNKLHKIKSQPPLIRVELPAEVNEKKLEEVYKIYSSLHKYQLFKFKKEETEGWYLYNLVAFLLFDFNPDKQQVGVTLFNNERFHLVTYFLIDYDEKDDEMIRNFIRISRGQDLKYKIMPGDTEYGKMYIQTFENIYLVSSIEGSAIMADSQQGALKFIDEFKGHFLSRYLWIYLLAFLQRQILVTLSKELMDIDLDDDVVGNSKNKLIDKLIKQSKVKVNTYFTSISDYTQHNVFYRFCVRQLDVKQHFDEIKEKINDLDIILKEQELKIKEQELKLKEDAKQSEKERNEELQILLGRLIIPQIFLALLVFFNITVDLKGLLADYYCVFVVIAFLCIIGLICFIFPVFKLLRRK
ncbi:MAG: hypothetical protein LBV72_04000 [Tannerella sp.]|jgi:hypothetical protein|nr:hypothetical protein [Tannerella sp.]